MKMRFVIILLLGIFGTGVPHASEAPEIREPLYHESLRPQFHFTARYWDEYQLHPPNHHEGWINDLNGLVYNDGVYHLFAQRWWSAWLHAVSTDLIHWEELKPAFGKGGRFGGTQSGGCVVDHNNTSGLGDGKTPPMIAFWSSTDNENQCISYSLDRGATWTKYENNPVLHHPFRDPNVFWFEPEQKWIMILYGPSDEIQKKFTYGFNGESNDAHDLMDFTPGQWVCSAIRVSNDGSVVVTDQSGQRQAKIDITKQNIAPETFLVGAKANHSEYFDGDVAEILIYDRTLTNDETESVLFGLRSKWGLIKPSAGRMQFPQEPVLHLDAATAISNRDNAVTRWNDLSGGEYAMTPPSADASPRLIHNALGKRPVLHFNGSQFMQGPAPLAEGDDSFTMIALWRRDSEEGSQVICEQNASAVETGRRASLLSVGRIEAENVYLLFSSKDLLHWTQLETSIPDSFECPDMFQLPVNGDATQKKWVVIDGNGDYVLGRFDGKRFTVDATKRKGDYGRNFYATMTFENMPQSDPRRIQLAWMRGWDDYPNTMPFNQQISFPCELPLSRSPDGISLHRYPIREIETLYDESFTVESQTINEGENPLAQLKGELFDLDLRIDVTQSTCSKIEFNLRGNTVSYDLTNHLVESAGSTAPLKVKDGRIELRILMDRLSIETYGNHGEISITNIAYQQDRDPQFSFNAIGGAVKIDSLRVNSLKSIWR
ncbi:MAG: hypothetical protein GC154_11110 [bacterium]|nr:hypothetical protein [bacterium]